MWIKEKCKMLFNFTTHVNTHTKYWSFLEANSKFNWFWIITIV